MCRIKYGLVEFALRVSVIALVLFSVPEGFGGWRKILPCDRPLSSVAIKVELIQKLKTMAATDSVASTFSAFVFMLYLPYQLD